MGIKKAKSKEIKRLTAGELGVPLQSTVTVEKIYSPHKNNQTQLLEGSAKEAAAKLVEKLKFEVRVI
jgi:electron transfer flavoprotein beta subunit